MVEAINRILLELGDTKSVDVATNPMVNNSFPAWEKHSSLLHAFTFTIGLTPEPENTVTIFGKSIVDRFCLTLPGKQLDLSVLLNEKKFRR